MDPNVDALPDDVIFGDGVRAGVGLQTLPKTPPRYRRGLCPVLASVFDSRGSPAAATVEGTPQGPSLQRLPGQDNEDCASEQSNLTTSHGRLLLVALNEVGATIAARPHRWSLSENPVNVRKVGGLKTLILRSAR